MLPDRHLNSRRYYDLLPPQTHACGDIWSGLPSFGLLGCTPIKGLVVTPACDLSQRKADTITYLPIIPVRAYFSTLGSLPETHRRTQSSLKAGRIPLELPWSADSFVPPKLHQIDAAIGTIQTYLSAKPRGASETSALHRAVAGLRIAEAITKPELTEVPAEDLAAFFGSEWSRMKERIAKNSFSSHVHFMPPDDQDPVYAGIPTPSVVLFRYPLTTSIELFDLAQNTTESSWADTITQTTAYLPIAANFRSTRPMKVLSMRTEFLHDLLSRYIAVYNRIGSPDFSEHAISIICDQMDEP